MQAWTTTMQCVTELAHRAGDGIEVSLLWHETGEGLTVICTDEHMGDWFALDAEPQHRFDVLLRVAVANDIVVEAASDGRVERPAGVGWTTAGPQLSNVVTSNLTPS